MRTLYFTNMLVVCAVLGTVLTDSSVHAANSSVVNSFSVSAETGGNSARDGEVIEGSERSSVDITTTINGETVTEIHETSDEGSISVESVTEVRNGVASTTTSIISGEGHDTDTLTGAVRGTPVAQPAPEPPTEPVATTTAVSATSSTITNTDDTIEQYEEVEAEPQGVLAQVMNVVSHAIAYVISLLFT